MSASDRTSYRVTGLDCAEEVAVLKRAVGPLVGGDEALAFDLLEGRMIVRRELDEAEDRAVRRSVAATGMRATPWRDGGGEPEGFWARRGSTVLCATSGLLALVGFLLHAVAAGGPRAALAAAGPPAAPAALYLAAVAAGLWRLVPRAWLAARHLRPDMNLLMTVAIAGALVIGEWLEAASVAFLFALALELERWSVGRARHAIEALLDLSPDVARQVDPVSGAVEEVAVEEVAVGARLRVRPGEKVPLDGRVVEGTTAVDRSAITGESMPVERRPGDPLFAGSVNGAGAIEMEVERPASDSTLARIIRMVEEARSRRAPTERWVERFARVYTPLMMGLAVLVAVVPPAIAGGDWLEWFYQALVLLVIACPCALVISTPVAVVAGLAAAARSGVLVKGGSFLEAPARLDVLALDKTGTLTRGEPRVQEVIPLDGHTAAEVLARAAALEAESTHPLAAAVTAEAERRGVAFRRAEELVEIPGKGATGRVDGVSCWIGSHRLVTERGVDEPTVRRLAQRLEDAGHSLVAVGVEDHVCGLLSVADEVRPGAAGAIDALRRAGVGRIVMVTGDNRRTAEAVGRAVGVDEVYAELLPGDKVAVIAELAADGRVAMVGDGVNDAPALAAADTGIAMGVAGSDAAIETADIALMADELERLPWLVRHSRRTLAVMRQNIAFSLAVKAAFIALAGLGVATLWMAIAADMGASLLVIFNALRLLSAGRGADDARAETGAAVLG